MFEEPKPKLQQIKSIPKNWVELPEDVYQDIIVKRRILEAPYSPKKWKFYLNIKSNRLIIPWNEYGELNYYQERAIKTYQDPKYLFPFDTEKAIFNIDAIDETSPYIYFTEGSFDSIFIKNAVAIGQVFPNNNQMEKLSSYLSELVWFPDNPWVDDTTRDKIISLGKKIPKQKVFMWDKNIKCKDINETVCKLDNLEFFSESYIQSRIITLDKAVITLRFK